MVRSSRTQVHLVSSSRRPAFVTPGASQPSASPAGPGGCCTGHRPLASRPLAPQMLPQMRCWGANTAAEGHITRASACAKPQRQSSRASVFSPELPALTSQALASARATHPAAQAPDKRSAARNRHWMMPTSRTLPCRWGHAESCRIVQTPAGNSNKMSNEKPAGCGRRRQGGRHRQPCGRGRRHERAQGRGRHRDDHGARAAGVGGS